MRSAKTLRAAEREFNAFQRAVAARMEVLIAAGTPKDEAWNKAWVECGGCEPIPLVFLGKEFR